jgi:hypothetical protein
MHDRQRCGGKCDEGGQRHNTTPTPTHTTSTRLPSIQRSTATDGAGCARNASPARRRTSSPTTAHGHTCSPTSSLSKKLNFFHVDCTHTHIYVYVCGRASRGHHSGGQRTVTGRDVTRGREGARTTTPPHTTTPVHASATDGPPTNKSTHAQVQGGTESHPAGTATPTAAPTIVAGPTRDPDHGGSRKRLPCLAPVLFPVAAVCRRRRSLSHCLHAASTRVVPVARPAIHPARVHRGGCSLSAP